MGPVIWLMGNDTGIHPQIYIKDPSPPIPPCVIASSAGGLQVFADHTHKRKHKSNAFMIFACHAAIQCVSVISLRPQYMQGTCAPDKSHFDYGKNLKTPKLSPKPGLRWCRFWYLWCISVSTCTITMILEMYAFPNFGGKLILKGPFQLHTYSKC